MVGKQEKIILAEAQAVKADNHDWMMIFGLLGLVVIAGVVIGLWHNAKAADPHYTGGTVAQNRGNLVIDPMLEMARGHVAGISTVTVSGRNIEIDDTIVADIWDGGSTGPVVSLIWLAPTAARVHTVASTSAVDVTFAGTLSLDAVVANTETVTIGTKTYTFLTVLVDAPNNVLIGANAAASIVNLVKAINLEAGAGTNYGTGTTGQAGVSAVDGAGDTMTLYATSAVATTETLAGGTNSWGGAVAVAGTGARTLRVYGLTDWDTAEVSEDINLTGVTAVTLANSYVMINRMEVLTNGATLNAGAIAATAATDATVSAHMIIGVGETRMAIYGIPSAQTAYIGGYYASANEAGGAAGLANVTMLVNQDPANHPTLFHARRTFGLISAGLNDAQYMRSYVPMKVAGPAIIKMQGLGGAVNMDITAGFDLVLVNN